MLTTSHGGGGNNRFPPGQHRHFGDDSGPDDSEQSDPYSLAPLTLAGFLDARGPYDQSYDQLRRDTRWFLSDLLDDLLGDYSRESNPSGKKRAVRDQDNWAWQTFMLAAAASKCLSSVSVVTANMVALCDVELHLTLRYYLSW